MKKASYLNLFLFSAKIGFKAILSGKITKEAVKRILCPLDPARYYELPKVLNCLRLKSGSRVLDVSSPKLLVYYLAEKNPSVEFYAIDKFEEELKNWDRIIKRPKNLHLLTEDATHLSFVNSYFEEVFSVSVLEHIHNPKGHGDSNAVREIYRVLKGNGRFLFTTMISNQFNEVFSNREMYSSNKTRKRTFFYRTYDYHTLTTRILKVAPFRIVREEVCNYRFILLESIFNRLIPFSAVFGFLFLLLAPLMINTSKSTNCINKRAEYFAILAK